MTLWLVTGVLLLSAAIVLLFRPFMPSVLAAYAGLWVMNLSGLTHFQSNEIVFWGIATVIVLGIDYLRVRPAVTTGYQRAYVAGGTLTGMILGLLISPTYGGVAGSAAGSVLVLVAYRMTPAGRGSSTAVIGSLCSVGLPAIVTCSIVALALRAVIAASIITQ